jgi:hypothetical protein
MERLEWNKNIFGANLEITRGDEIVGSVQWQNMFSNKARAEFRGKTFFISRDIMLSRLEVFDGKTQALLAAFSKSFSSPKRYNCKWKTIRTGNEEFLAITVGLEI